MAWASGTSTAWTWLASSRVGTRTRPRGRPGAGVPVGQPGDQRDREPERLARAGPAAAQDVPPGQRIRQRGRLDRERHGDAGVGQHLDQRPGHAQVSEAGIQRGRAGQAVGLAGCPGYALRLAVLRGLAGGWRTAGGGPDLAGRRRRRRAAEFSMGRAVTDDRFRISGWPHFRGPPHQIRGNLLAQRAMYDRRARMAAPHDVPCATTVPHSVTRRRAARGRAGSHPQRVMPAPAAAASVSWGARPMSSKRAAARPRGSVCGPKRHGSGQGDATNAIARA